MTYDPDCMWNMTLIGLAIKVKVLFQIVWRDKTTD